jgi:hypothetical protein
MTTAVSRREVHFKTLDDVIGEVLRLQKNGYRSLGNWTLGQACFHLAEWARFPMDGFPKPPFFIRAIFGAMKMFGQVEKMKRGILANGFKPGLPTAPQTAPKADEVTDAAGVQKLQEVIERMKKWQGPLHPSPLFGNMDPELWTKVTLLHCEHHLGYIAPN